MSYTKEMLGTVAALGLAMSAQAQQGATEAPAAAPQAEAAGARPPEPRSA